MIYQNSKLWTHKRKGIVQRSGRVVLDLHRLDRLASFMEGEMFLAGWSSQ